VVRNVLTGPGLALSGRGGWDSKDCTSNWPSSTWKRVVFGFAGERGEKDISLITLATALLVTVGGGGAIGSTKKGQ